MRHEPGFFGTDAREALVLGSDVPPQRGTPSGFNKKHPGSLRDGLDPLRPFSASLRLCGKAVLGQRPETGLAPPYRCLRNRSGPFRKSRVITTCSNSSNGTASTGARSHE